MQLYRYHRRRRPRRIHADGRKLGREGSGGHGSADRGSRQVLQVTPTEMLFGKFHIIGSSQGPRHRLREVLELHQRSNARTLVEDYTLDDAATAYERVRAGSVRFRAVLVPSA